MTGYSGTPLYKKLGIKAGSLVYLQNAPARYPALLEGLPGDVLFTETLEKKPDLIHLFTNDFHELTESLTDFRHRVKETGSIWVSWYKKASRLETELTEDTIRQTALGLGLVDIKVCAIDEIWSGLKLVIRRENRKH